MGIRSIIATTKQHTNPNELFGWVDLFKLFCAILVTVSHTHAFKGFGAPIYYGSIVISRVAVPYFFVASGFLLFRKISGSDSGSDRIFSYLRKIGKFYIIWTLIYSPFMVRDAIRTSTSETQVVSALLKAVFLVGYHHLWYLLSLIVAVFIIYLLRHLGLNNKLILLIGLGTYVLGLFGEEFYRWSLDFVSANQYAETVFHWYFIFFDSTRNGIFDALLFVAIGMWIAGHPINVPTSVVMLLVLVSCVGLEVEAYIVHSLDIAKDGVIPNDLFLFLIPGAFSAFVLSMRQLVPLGFRTVHARNFSTVIYFVHPWVQYIVVVFERCISRLTGGRVVELGNMLSFLVVLLICLIIYRVILYLEQYSCFRWLRHLYR